MYVRPQNYRYPTGVRLPENYSGNTFRETSEEQSSAKPEAAPELSQAEEKKEDESARASLLSEGGFKLRLGSLFDGKKIGSEELLIIALILLLADSENNDDLILFLILLFFIK